MYSKNRISEETTKGKTMAVNQKDLQKCTQCPYHQVESDPDPDDWFCDDDVKVRCIISTSSYRGNHCKEPYITVGCRPYRVTNETDIPDWCPLKEEKK